MIRFMLIEERVAMRLVYLVKLEAEMLVGVEVN